MVQYQQCSAAYVRRCRVRRENMTFRGSNTVATFYLQNAENRLIIYFIM